MTSVLRRIAQQEPRTQYFYASGPVAAYVLDPASSIAISPVMEMTAFVTAFATDPGSSVTLNASLLKDLGRQITVYNNSTSGVVGSPHIAIFRQVMSVSGLNTEGVVSPQDPMAPTMAYICTWVDGIRMAPFVVAEVARTG